MPNFFTYNAGVPNAPDDPADDQPEMLQNTQSTANLINVDHVGFNLSGGGVHRQVTMFLNESNPGIGDGVSALYSNNTFPDALPYPFWSQGATAFPLAGPKNASSKGYTYLAGALILQWGITTIPVGSSETGTVTFLSETGLAFPNNCFNVQLTLINKSSGTASSSNTLSLRDTSISNTSFDWSFNGNSGSFPSFFWFAIGN